MNWSTAFEIRAFERLEVLTSARTRGYNNFYKR